MSYVSFAAEVCLGGPPLGMGVDSDISPMDGALSMDGTLSMTHTGEVSTMNVWFIQLFSTRLTGIKFNCFLRNTTKTTTNRLTVVLQVPILSFLESGDISA